MSNIYAVGDIHGRLDLLELAIESIETHAGDEGGTFISLGDFVDRGPESKGVIDRLKTGPDKDNWNWIVLQGNHEAMMIECLDHPHLLGWWMGNGGNKTLASYGYEHGDSLVPLKQELRYDLDWLYNLPIYHQDDYRIFVHAGLMPDKLPEENTKEILQWVLYNDINDTPHISGKHIVHGHHQSENHPLLLPHRTNLDSFAWYTGRLAIGVFNDSQANPVEILEVNGHAY